MINSIGS